MEPVLDREKLLQNLNAWQLPCTAEQLEQLEQYAALLTEWNQKMNLTAITSPEGIAVLHFADSLSLLSALSLPRGAALLDVGTGAGFPAIPIAIFRPDIRLTMMDSLQKRLTFLQEVLSRLGLTADLRHSRAEESAGDPALREGFDVVTARAVAHLQVLSEYCLPYVKIGGCFAAMKGPSCQQELSQADRAIALLGGRVQRVAPFTLSDGSARFIALIEKVKETPAQYPRHGAKIAKKPL